MNDVDEEGTWVWADGRARNPEFTEPWEAAGGRHSKCTRRTKCLPFPAVTRRRCMRAGTAGSEDVTVITDGTGIWQDFPPDNHYFWAVCMLWPQATVALLGDAEVVTPLGATAADDGAVLNLTFLELELDPATDMLSTVDVNVPGR